MINYLEIEKILPHEKIDFNNLEKIRVIVKEYGNKIFKPLIVDKNSFVLLDGHHRFHIAKELGLKKVPVILIDYFDKNLVLETKQKITKDDVIKSAKQKKLFSPKTTFHFLLRNGEKKHISEFF